MNYKDYTEKHRKILEPVNEIIMDLTAIGTMISMCRELNNDIIAEQLEEAIVNIRDEYGKVEV